MLIWNIKCECEYFFWFCLFFDSGNRKWKQTVSTENGDELFLSLDVVQLVFKEYLEVWLKLYKKLLLISQITVQFKQLTRLDTPVVRWQEVTASAKIKQLTTFIKTWDRKGSRHLVLRCPECPNVPGFLSVSQESTVSSGSASEEEASPWRPGQMLSLFVDLNRSTSNKQVSSFSNISSELQVIDCRHFVEGLDQIQALKCQIIHRVR